MSLSVLFSNFYYYLFFITGGKVVLTEVIHQWVILGLEQEVQEVPQGLGSSGPSSCLVCLVKDPALGGLRMMPGGS